MTAPTVTPLPTAPQRTMSPDLYKETADPWAAALGPWGSEVEAVGQYVQNLAVEIDDTIAAADAALDAKLASGGWVGTSTTAVSIGAGSKTLTIQPNLSFRRPAWVLAGSASDVNKWIVGQVDTYNLTTGAMTIIVPADGFSGSGTVSDWNVILTGMPGMARALASAAEIRAGADTAKGTSSKSHRDALAIETLTDAATIAWDINVQGSQAKVTLGGNRTIGKPSNLYSGCPVILLINPATYTPTWNAVWNFGATGVFVPPANVWSKVSGTYDAALDKIQVSSWSGA